MANAGSSGNPTIQALENGPFKVTALENFTNSKGDTLETKPAMFLCRCGGSANKPFCDGTHKTNGFSSAKVTDGSIDWRDDYVAKAITVHDNRGICSHAGYCSDRLASVFKLGAEPWIDPDGASPDEIAAAAKRCPSGALSHSIGGTERRDQDREPAIMVSKDGPYDVTGRVEIDEPRAEGASEEHYTLCRCGASKNKPFCDGTHWDIKFTDE